MKLLNLILGIFLISLAVTSCSDDQDSSPRIGDKRVIISKSEYQDAPDDNLTINKVELSGNCLKINFGASGCDGKTWKVELIDSDELIESDPPQRRLRLSLENYELCDAYISKEISFDISKLKVNGNKVILNIKGYDTPIIYKY